MKSQARPSLGHDSGRIQLLLKFSAVTALAASMMACSGNAKVDGQQGPVTGKQPPGTGTCEPTGDIPCYVGIAEPCKDFHTTFDGDEYCMAPPDPTLGTQLHVGPDDYTDPNQTSQYMIDPGGETNWAEVKTSTNTELKFTRGYHSHMRPGSHHFILFGLNQAPTTTGPTMNGGGAESAVGAVGGTFLGGATRQVQNIDTKGEYPEDQGIGSEMAPQRPIAVNLHFINITDHPLLQEIWVNFIYIDEAEVTQYVKPITWYGGYAMSIPPGAHQLLQNSATACTAPDSVRLAMMTGHVHANTLRITTTVTQAGATDPTLLFEDYNWHEPTEWRFDRAHNWPAPDAATKTNGGYSGVMNVAPGDQFHWECDVLNRSNSTLTFSNKVYDGEMCNVFGFYYTTNRDAKPWTCIFL
jgi:hypothetical protein